jgi:hypothetical protein
MERFALVEIACSAALVEHNLAQLMDVWVRLGLTILLRLTNIVMVEDLARVMIV